MPDKINVFVLEDDRKKANVRFIYSSILSYEPVYYHWLGSSYGNDAECMGDDCPHCKEQNPRRKRYFIPFYNLKTNQIEYWVRSGFTYGTLCDLYKRYPDVTNYEFEIIRHTTYEFVCKKKLVENLEIAGALPNAIDIFRSLLPMET